MLELFKHFNDVINEITRIIQQFNDFKIIFISGDFNKDLTSDKHRRSKEFFIDFF